MIGYASALFLFGLRRFACLFIGPACGEPFCGRVARDQGMCFDHLGPATLEGRVHV